ncbi:MAG: pyruvate kinase [Actinomycetota bacterium]
MRRTKIVCTIGPASQSPKILKELMLAGMNIARLNLSYGSKEYHSRNISNLRRIAKELGIPIAILIDLQGPKIRIGGIHAGKVHLKAGSQFTLTARRVPGDQERVSINFPQILKDISPRDTIFIDDGLIQLLVKEKTESDVKCEVIAGGELSPRKGVNLPDVTVSVPSITQKDKEDLFFGLDRGVDWVALSFVRKAEDVLALKKLIEERGASIPVMAKIEKHEAVKNIDEIIEVSDGIMVARGDLGVEISTEEVPIVQKRIINGAIRAGKPVITATQMLDSMVRSPRPTRAEASDVANAIFDGTDAVMLSGETAVGSYPIESVRIMAKLIERAESVLDYAGLLEAKSRWVHATTADAIAFAACHLASILRAKAIITSTQSGYTARQVSKYRPGAPIIAVSPNPEVTRRLLLSWGVVPLKVRPSENIDDMLSLAVDATVKARLVKRGDTVIITAGVLVNVPGTTNLIKVHRVE